MLGDGLQPQDVSGGGTGRTGLGTQLSLDAAAFVGSQPGRWSQGQSKGVTFDDLVMDDEGAGSSSPGCFKMWVVAACFSSSS